MATAQKLCEQLKRRAEVKARAAVSTLQCGERERQAALTAARAAAIIQELHHAAVAHALSAARIPRNQATAAKRAFAPANESHINSAMSLTQAGTAPELQTQDEQAHYAATRNLKKLFGAEQGAKVYFAYHKALEELGNLLLKE